MSVEKLGFDDLKKARENKGMTQTDVARAVGVSLAGYRLWESKGGFPNEKNLEKLKVVLGIK